MKAKEMFGHTKRLFDCLFVLPVPRNPGKQNSQIIVFIEIGRELEKEGNEPHILYMTLFG